MAQQAIERQLLEKLGLQFGAQILRNEDVGDDGEPAGTEAANAA